MYTLWIRKHNEHYPKYLRERGKNDESARGKSKDIKSFLSNTIHKYQVQRDAILQEKCMEAIFIDENNGGQA